MTRPTAMSIDVAAWFAGKNFTADWTSRNYDVWAEVLAPYRDARWSILEIGSWEGRSALFFLNYLPHARIVCVDTFEGSAEHRSWSLWRRARQLRAIERRFDANVAAFGARVEKIKALSLVALGELGVARRRFDFAYVDGSHLALDVYRDAVLTWPLVVPGGVLAFDDYQRTLGPAGDRPAIGIDAFLATVPGRYEEIFRGHQLIVRKRRE